MKPNKIVWIIILGLFVKALWILHPDKDVPWELLHSHRYFPFSDVEITNITYVSMICDKSLWLIWTFGFILLLPEYRKPLSVLFIIQALQFGEFFLNYNDTGIVVSGFTLNLTLAKLTIPACMIIFQQTWKDKS